MNYLLELRGLVVPVSGAAIILVAQQVSRTTVRQRAEYL
jgi:hypothetical protein